MATIFSVIGSHNDNPDRLLALGDDGVTYQLELPAGAPTPVDASEDWRIDSTVSSFDDLLA